MGGAYLDLSCVEDEDPVTLHHGLEAVGDCEDRAVAELILQRLLDEGVSAAEVFIRFIRGVLYIK